MNHGATRNTAGQRQKRQLILGLYGRRLAALVALQLQEHGLHCPTPTFATHASQLDALRQQTESQTSTKGLLWVSEFKTIQQIPASQPVPSNARLIGTPAVGYIASASQKTIGIHREP